MILFPVDSPRINRTNYGELVRQVQSNLSSQASLKLKFGNPRNHFATRNGDLFFHKVEKLS
jgi:hypothetical protein